MEKPLSSEAKNSPSPFSNLETCAFAPGKEAWKRDGNFFSAEELRHMDADASVTLYQPLEKILIAD